MEYAPIRQRAGRRPALTTLPPTLGLWLVAAFAIVLIGAATAGATAGSMLWALLLACSCIAATFLVLGVLGFPTLLAWPVLTGIAYPFLRYPTLSPIVTFDRIWIIGLLGAITFAASRPRSCRETRFLVGALVALTVAYGLRAFTTPGATLGTYRIWIDAIVLPLVLFVATLRLATSRARLRQLTQSLMIGGLMLGLIGILDFALGLHLANRLGSETVNELGVYRLTGPFSAAEPYGLSLLVCFAVTIYCFVQRRGAVRLGIGAIAVVELVAVGLTLFRAAWIGAILILITTYGLRRGRAGRLLIVGVLVGILVVGAVSQLKGTQLYQQRVDNTDNVWTRLATYEQGVDMFRTNPLFGIGVDRYHTAAQLRVPREVKGVQSVTFPHSSFVGLLAEQGIVGFSMLIVVCIAVFRLLRAYYRESRATDDQVLAGAVIGAALAYLTMSLSLTMLPYGPSNAFFVVILGIVAVRLDALRRGDGPDTSFEPPPGVRRARRVASDVEAQAAPRERSAAVG